MIPEARSEAPLSPDHAPAPFRAPRHRTPPRSQRAADWSVRDLGADDPVTKGRKVLAADHLRRARPWTAGVQQAGHPAPDMPVRELRGVRPPLRGLINDRGAAGAVRIHCSPKEVRGDAAGASRA